MRSRLDDHTSTNVDESYSKADVGHAPPRNESARHRQRIAAWPYTKYRVVAAIGKVRVLVLQAP